MIDRIPAKFRYADHISAWFMVLPIGFFIVYVLLTIMLWPRYWPSLKSWLGSRRRNRAALSAIPALLITVIAPATMDRRVVKDIIFGQLTVTSFLGICAFTLSLALFSWSSIVQYVFSDVAVDEASRARTVLQEMQRFAAFNQSVARSFLKIVRMKYLRVQACVAELDTGKPFDPEMLHRALSPQKQHEGVMFAIYDLLNKRAGDSGRLRIAYFEIEGDFLVPKMVCDGQMYLAPLPDLSDFQEKFRVGTQRPGSLAAAVANTGKLEIVPNAAAAHRDADHPFKWFTSPEVDDIGSIVAIPIGESTRLPVRRVLTIDSDKPDLFSNSETSRMELALLVDNVNERLMFEASMAKLLGYLQPRRQPHHA